MGHFLWAIFGRFLAIIFVLTLLVTPPLYVLTAAGLITLPTVGAWLYTPPLPDHPVTAGRPVDAKEIASLTFDEASLTASLRDGLARFARVIDVSGAQVAVVEEKGLEIFLPLKGNAEHSALTLRVIMNLEDGKIVPAISAFYLGRLPLAPSAIEPLLGSALQTAFSSLAGEIKKIVTVKSVEYTDGTMFVHGLLTADSGTP